MPNNRKGSKTRIPSVEETNEELAKEFAEQDSKAKDLLLKKIDSDAPNESMQSSSVPAEKAEETVSDGSTFGSDGRPLREPKGTLFPDIYRQRKDTLYHYLNTFI